MYPHPLCLQIPIGQEEEFRGVVDLVEMKAIYWYQEDQGLSFREDVIPEELISNSPSYLGTRY